MAPQFGNSASIGVIERITLGGVFALVAIGLALSYADTALFDRYYVVEDGVIEWLTIVGFLVGAVICFRRAVRLRGCRPASFVALTVLLGLALVFCAGEEISWGQRVFEFASPEWFAENNAQRESNIHNLKIGEVKLNRVIFTWALGGVLLAYFAVLSPLYLRSRAVARLADRLAVPVPRPYQWIAVLALIVIVELLVNSHKRSELLEFGASFLFMLIVAFPYNKAVYNPAVALDAVDGQRG